MYIYWECMLNFSFFLEKLGDHSLHVINARTCSRHGKKLMGMHSISSSLFLATGGIDHR